MNQSLFSDITLKYLSKNHPDFLKTVDFKKDQSFDCSIKSRNGNRFLYIATYDCEITIGFENTEKKCDWHFHVGTSQGNYQTEELKEMSKVLDDILNNQQVFILKNNQYIPIEKNDYEFILKTKENTKFYTWNEI